MAGNEELKIQQYKVKLNEELGKGQFAVVCKASHVKDNGTPLAAKEIQLNENQDSN